MFAMVAVLGVMGGAGQTMAVFALIDAVGHDGVSEWFSELIEAPVPASCVYTDVSFPFCPWDDPMCLCIDQTPLNGCSCP